MHLGIMARTIPRSSLEETLNAIADLGIRQVQFNFSCAGMPTLPDRIDEDLCVWIARAFRERGLTMTAVSGTFNLCDPDASRLATNLRRLGLLAAACRWLDTRIVTLCTGTLDPDNMWNGHPGNVRRSTWETLIQSMREAVKLADRHEVTLAFEPERNNVVHSVARARMLLDQIGSPWLKVVLDVANLMTTHDRPRLVEILDEAREWLGPEVVLAHAKIPPYLEGEERMSRIREFTSRLEPVDWLHRIALTQMAEPLKEAEVSLSEGEEKLLEDPVPEELLSLHEYLTCYVGSLGHVGFTGSAPYPGALIMHGMAEEDVGPVENILSGLVH